MQAWLRAQWGVEARVLHDRPPAFFRPLPPQERHELLTLTPKPNPDP